MHEEDASTASGSGDNELVLVEKQKAKSPVWNFFGYKPNSNGKPMDENKPVCKICHREVAVKGGNTTNLFSHLKQKHFKEYSELKLYKDPRQCHQIGRSNSQPTIQQAFANTQNILGAVNIGNNLLILSPNALQKICYHYIQLTSLVSVRCWSVLIIDMICLPINIFLKYLYLHFIQSYVVLWLRSYRKFATTHVQLICGQAGPSPMHELHSFHYLDREWSFQSRCLETFFLPVDHTAINLAEALADVRQSWNLMEKDQVSITTDNGANMISAANTLRWLRLSCFDHCLNLAVTNSLKDDQRVTRALGVARSIVRAFSVSWKRRRDLAKVQVEKNLPQHSLIADCPTRWGSMGKMTARLLEQDEAVQVVLSSDRKTRHLIATWQDIHVWESLHKALSPLDELTDFLSGDSHITVSSIIPVLHNLATKLLKETQDDSELTKTMKKITDYLKGKYSESTIQDILHMATFLDPRFKLDYIEGANREMLEDSILDEGMEILTLTASPTSSVQATPQTEGAEKELRFPRRKSW